MDVVCFDHVDVIFGPTQKSAFEMLDAGAGRDEIFAKTQNVVGVHDASLTVKEGEICVLMGLSGSGKSSLLRCVNGLNTVSRGRMLVRDGERVVDVASCDRATLRHLRTERISMVFQQFALMPWRTIRENVGFGLELSGLTKSERDRIVMEKLAMVQLEKWADKHPHELSGGMQQRVGLARALATEADILLMDEPFSALDPLIREHLQDELIQIQQDLKKTIIFVSHDLDEALKLGSNIAIMESGRIVQNGTPEDIVTNPKDNYVRRFVASMNPLKVLRCASVMRPVETLEPVDGRTNAVALDPHGMTVCALDSGRCPECVTVSGALVSLIAFRDDLDLKSLPKGTMIVGTVETPMRVALEAHHATGLPMPVVDCDGKLMGVVGREEIFNAILRESEVTSIRD